MLCLPLLAAVFLGSCATSQYQFEYQARVADKVWPQGTDVPRLRYVGMIRGEDNFKKVEGSEGLARKGVNWFGRLLFGEEEPRRLYRPQSGVVDDENQRLYVADVGTKSIFVFNFKDGSLDVWEGLDNDTAFLTPIAVCLLDQNEIFVTDADHGYVVKFDATGKSLQRIGERELSRPTGLACDKKNKKVYVADSQTHRIQVFSADGNHQQTFGKKGAGDGDFNSPTHLSFANNKLYVSDTLNARVQVFDSSGKWLRSFGKRGMYVGNLPRPKGVAVDSENQIYVIESYYDHLLIFDEAGNGLLPVGGSGDQPGQFNLPAGIWIDNNDLIYVADMFNSRIAVFQYLKMPATP